MSSIANKINPLYRPASLLFDRIRIGGSASTPQILQSNIFSLPLLNSTEKHVQPVVLLHGLLSGKDGWGPYLRYLHAAMKERGQESDILVVNARHHGVFPSNSSLQHPLLSESTGQYLVDMVGDTLQFASDISLSYVHKPILIGHSMGAKVGEEEEVSFKNHVVAYFIIIFLKNYNIMPNRIYIHIIS